MLYSQICLMLIFSNILAFPMAIYGYCLNEISGKFVQIDTRKNQALCRSLLFRFSVILCSTRSLHLIFGMDRVDSTRFWPDAADGRLR